MIMKEPPLLWRRESPTTCSPAKTLLGTRGEMYYCWKYMATGLKETVHAPYETQLSPVLRLPTADHTAG